jgi:glycosyltransferase involved in cell wall biosynthesis
MNNIIPGLTSVIIPTHNRTKYICDAIGSVLNQTCKDYEIIIVDDGSTDGTKDLLAEYYEKITYIYQDHKGVSAARNRGFRESKGEYIVFLDSDDFLCPQMIKTCANLFKQKDCTAIFGIASTVKSRDGFMHRYTDRAKENENIFAWIIKGKVLVMGQFALKRFCLEELGGFNEKNIYGEDWELLLKISRRYNFCYVPVEFVKKRSHKEKRIYNYKMNFLISERFRILEEIFGKEAENFKKAYIDKKVIANWHNCVGFSQSKMGNVKDARRQVFLSLKIWPFQPSMYIWLIYQSLPSIVHRYWRSLKRQLSFKKSELINSDLDKRIKVAVTSSGLGHIPRGAETWAKDLASVLYEKDVNVNLYSGSRLNSYTKSGIMQKTIPCLKRTSKLTKIIKKIRPSFLWHLGLGNEYDIEQTSFSFFLLCEAIMRKYDIIHTQDPVVANILNIASKLHLIKAKVILAHGTEEQVEFIKKFDYVQHLAPYHLEEVQIQLVNGKKWFAIPNFVNTMQFKPDRKMYFRKKLGIPDEAFVILSVAAVKNTHKRLDYLIKAVVAFKNRTKAEAFLIIAGSETPETQKVIQLSRNLLGNNVKFFLNRCHEQMPEIYNCADVFVLCSFFEMFGIVLVEAMACRLPVIAHRHPVMEWIIGGTGECIDMTQEGELADALKKYLDETFRKKIGEKARLQILGRFSQDMISKQILDMYQSILDRK